MLAVELDFADLKNPLFLYLQEKNWKSALEKVKKCPRLARQTVSIAGFYDAKSVTKVNAVQMACAHRAPVEVIVTLHGINSKLISQHDPKYNRNALHIAVLKKAPSNVVAALLEACPKAAKTQDKFGKLPIHYACKDQANGSDSIRYLLNAHPESASVIDIDGCLPLHIACQNDLPLTGIRSLVRAHPRGIFTPTKDGLTTPTIIARQRYDHQKQILQLQQQQQHQHPQGPRSHHRDDVLYIPACDTVSLLLRAAEETKKHLRVSKEASSSSLISSSSSSTFTNSTNATTTVSSTDVQQQQQQQQRRRGHRNNTGVRGKKNFRKTFSISSFKTLDTDIGSSDFACLTTK